MKMKKFLALMLALVMALALCACGGETTEPAEGAEGTETTEPTGTEAVSPDDIEDTMTSEDGTYEVAFVTDVGQLKDKSFNEGT